MPEQYSKEMETKSQENNAKHSKDFEVQDQAQSSKDDGELKLHCSCTVASISPNSKAVKSGARIALQPLYQKLVWLGCAGNLCGKASCPRLFMEGRDWYTCWGEVFEIYRLNGEGPVKVGDLVGFNYFYFSYVPSVITVWNTLPVDIRSSSSVSVFKHNLLHWAHVLY